MPIEFDIASCSAAADDGTPAEMVLVPSALKASSEDVIMVGGSNFTKMSDRELEENISKYSNHKRELKLLDSTRIECYIKALETEKARRRSKRNNPAGGNSAIASHQRVYFEKPSSDAGSGGLRTPSLTPNWLSNSTIKEKRPDEPSPSFLEQAEVIRFRTYSRKKRPEEPPPQETSKPLKRLQSLACGGRASKLRKGASADSAVVLDDDEEEEVHCLAEATDLEKPASYCRTSRRSLRLAETKKMFDRKIAYPSRDDPDAVEVYYRDLQRLNPAEFLNDTVIDFYIKYIQKTEVECCHDKNPFYFFNSFFFKKLSEAFDYEIASLISAKQKQAEAFSKLRKWTKGVDIFDKSYLFIPINDKLHWSLAIVCFSMPEDEDDNMLIPFIYHLDSLESGHPSRGIFNCLQRYLEAEHEHTKCSSPIDWKKRVTKRVEVPRQDNEYDCGLFLLYYIKLFVQKAPLPCKLTETSAMFGRRWFKPVEASGLRGLIQELLIKLFEETA